MAIVYQHRRLDTNEVFYIGIGKDKSRAFNKRGRNYRWKSIVNKTDYAVDILISGISWECACEVETGLILEYGREDLQLGPLANLTDGGDGAYNPSEETRKKISKNRTYATGKKHHLWGINHSEETKLKMKINHADFFGERNPFWGKKHSLDAIKKISESKIGVRPHNYGKKMSEAQRIKIKQIASNRRKIECEYCKRIIDICNHSRWHGEKCKEKK